MYYELSNNDFYGKFMKMPEVQKMFEHAQELKLTMIKMKQMEIAMEGNVQMLIHLGKTECGQSEKTEINSSITVKDNLTKEALNNFAKAILNEIDE